MTTPTQDLEPILSNIPENTPVVLTVGDLVTIIKFLSNLSEMRRLSDIELDAITPAFNNIAAFIKANAQPAATQEINDNNGTEETNGQ